MYAPPTVNGVKSTVLVEKAFDVYCGAESILLKLIRVSEDCLVLATACGAPYVYTLYGKVEHEKWEQAGKEERIRGIPNYHSAFFRGGRFCSVGFELSY